MNIKTARKLYEDERHHSCKWEEAVVYLQAIEKFKGLVDAVKSVLSEERDNEEYYQEIKTDTLGNLTQELAKFERGK